MNIPNELTNYLKSQKLMSVATYDERPWIAVVFYVMDDDLNFYFISDPETKHAKYIGHNPQTAVAIYDSAQVVTDKKVGVQMHGRAEIVSGLSQIEWFFKMWQKLNPGIEVLTYPNYINKVLSSMVYKFVPHEIQFFNEALYPDTELKLFAVR